MHLVCSVIDRQRSVVFKLTQSLVTKQKNAKYTLFCIFDEFQENLMNIFILFNHLNQIKQNSSECFFSYSEHLCKGKGK